VKLIPKFHKKAEQVLSDQDSKQQRMWHPVAAISYVILLYVLSQLAASFLLVGVLYAFGWDIHRITDWLGSDTFAQFLFVLLTEIVTVGGIVWFLKRRGFKLAAIGWNKPKLKYLGLAVIGFGIYFLGYVLVSIIAGLLLPSLNFDQRQELGFEQTKTTIELLLVFISLVVLPPIAEEIVFRGFLFTSLRKRLPFIWTAVITSILFAIPHLQFGSNAPLLWVAALDTLVLSVVLCYVRERTGSLWPGIFIHVLKNGIAFTALFLLV